MSQYTHILLAADFNPESAKVNERAKAMQAGNNCALSIIHVLEPISIAYGGEFPVNLGELHKELEKQAREQLEQLADSLAIPASNRYLEIGITEKEILRVAREKGVDLIIMGSHGKHGLSLLLGSTANAILHRAECDVLAVRVHKE